MSKIEDHVLLNAEKRDIQTQQNIQKRHRATVDFIFQDESRISVPLSIVKNFPKSILFLTYENQKNYLQNEEAYFIDSLSFSLDKLIEYLDNSLDLDSLPLNDIINVFTKDKNSLFLQYSCLFGFFNVTKVIINFDFDEDIPYEYIYPSNLHSIFPKLENYIIKLYYYPQKQYIKITSLDSHYLVLYKEYKRIYCKYNYKAKYIEYKVEYPEIEMNALDNDQIHLYLNIDNNKNKEILDEKIDIDIDEEMNIRKDEEKPDLCIESLSDYSHEYNNQQKNSQVINSKDTIQKKCLIYEFYFLDNNGELDMQHPTLKQCNNENDEIFSYILNINICKQLKEIPDDIFSLPVKLQVNIPPLLKALKDGTFDNLEVFNIHDFIQSGSYLEYKNIFKNILKTHVFPNVTTISTYNWDQTKDDMIMMISLLALFTKEHFPKLHIYDLHYLYFNSEEDKITDLFPNLFPDEFIELIDTILLVNKNKHIDIHSFVTDDSIPMALCELLETHSLNLYIYTYFLYELWDKEWGKLFDTNTLIIDKILFNFDCLPEEFSEEMDLDLSKYSFKTIFIKSDMHNPYSYDSYESLFQNINCQCLEEISIYIEDTIDEDNCDYLLNIFSLLKHINSYSVKSLEIYEDTDSVHNEKVMNTYVDSESIEIYNSFFSSFSDSLQSLTVSSPFFVDYLFIIEECNMLPLWTNLENLNISFNEDSDISDSLEGLFNYLNTNKLSKLKTLHINFYYSIDFTDIYNFIELFKNNSDLYLPNFNQFSITFFDGEIDPSTNPPILLHINNVFESFPSLSLYLHKRINSIIMIHDYSEEFDDYKQYSTYIYEQLQMEYTHTISNLFILTISDTFTSKVIQLITKEMFPYLRQFQYKDTNTTRIDTYKDILEQYKMKQNRFLSIKDANEIIF
ncbi:hypothetical protein WA158_004246 [Blastocystis sp. Blastoise]